MPHDPAHGYAALRRGRHSESGATYFITFCTEERASGLTTALLAQSIVDETRAMEHDAVWATRCMTIMPDHVHLLVTLGATLSLGRAVARLKSLTTPCLVTADLRWQSGYFDHRLRDREEVLPYFLYTYLNPYRANLIAASDEWPWFVCSDEDRAWFGPLLHENRPEPAWLADLP
jgi:putative transposase